MRVTTTDGYELLFVQEKPDAVLVYGSDAAVDCFTNGVTLAGTEVVDGPEPGSERSTGVSPQPAPVLPSEAPPEAAHTALRVTAGTVALWLTFETLNML